MSTRTIRLSCDLASGAALVNERHVISPADPNGVWFFAGDDVNLELTLFSDGQLVDVSNINSLRVRIAAGGVNLVDETIPGASLDDTLTIDQWRDLSGEHYSLAIDSGATAAMAAGRKQLLVTALTTDVPPIESTYANNPVLVRDAGLGGNDDPPAAEPGYFTKPESDGRFAPMSANIGSMDPAKYKGQITAQSDDLIDPNTGSGYWYYVNGVDGVLTGANNPTDAVEDGGFVISDGTDWLVRGKQPFSIPTDYIQESMIAAGEIKESLFDTPTKDKLERTKVWEIEPGDLAYMEQNQDSWNDYLSIKDGHIVIVNVDSDTQQPIPYDEWQIFLIMDSTKVYAAQSTPIQAGYADISPSVIKDGIVTTQKLAAQAVTLSKLSDDLQSQVLAAKSGYLYQGMHDASTGAPTPTATSQAWLINVEGSFGGIDWQYGDTAVWNGTGWARIPYEYENFVYDGGNLGDPEDAGDIIDGGSLA